ncbi:MAG TPA: prepilin peptidase [Candidatus Polarisedimenticolia bacterium]|nr:prepilin peptidase [Candidatus Polarisedimenticolia bacterium]
MSLVPLLDGFEPVVAAILGLIFGSFANVCIHRLPQRLSVVWPGSSCPRCHEAIAWYDNLPVVSWLLLRGRCRRCGAGIPAIYPLVEASVAALFVLLCLQHGLTPRWAALAYLSLSIVVLIPIDYRHGILPDRVTLPGIAVGLLVSPLSADPGFIRAVIGAATGALVPLSVRALYMAYARVRWSVGRRTVSTEPFTTALAVEEGEYAEERREGMGLGDVKMLAMVGAFLGAPRVILTMFLGSVIGTLMVVPLVLAGRRSMKTPVPFGPFLGVAALASMLLGAEILDWYFGLVIPLP